MGEETPYTHDVFISYSHVNREWVRGELLPRLENAGLKVIIDYRDFELGVPILVNIRRAVDKSRHTLMVFTPAWLKSEWAELESNLLTGNDPANRRRKIIPLLLEPCEVPSHLSILAYSDFTQLPEREAQMARLVGAISPPKQPTPDPAPKIQPVGISKGLKALEELVRQDSEVRQAMAAVRTKFESTIGQIKILGDYKDMHDQLHMLQFKCSNGIEQEIKRLPNSDEAVENLRLHDMTLQTIVSLLQEISSHETFAAYQIDWIRDLDEAQKNLDEAIEKIDIGEIKKINRKIKRILNIYPSDINTRLNSTARNLGLNSLVQAIEEIRIDLNCLKEDMDKRRRFEEGIEELSSLNVELVVLVSDHDGWQFVDLQLRGLESSLNGDMDELEESWAHLKNVTMKLCKGRSEGLITKFTECSDGFGQAIVGREPAKIAQIFLRYQMLASQIFLVADTRLKNFCDKLREYDGPLASLSRNIR